MRISRDRYGSVFTLAIKTHVTEAAAQHDERSREARLEAHRVQRRLQARVEPPEERGEVALLARCVDQARRRERRPCMSVRQLS